MGFITGDMNAYPFWMQEVAQIHPQDLAKPSVDIVVTLAAYASGASQGKAFYYFPGKVSNLRDVPFGGSDDWITAATNKSPDRRVELKDRCLAMNHFDTDRPSARNLFGKLRYPMTADIAEILGQPANYNGGFTKVPLNLSEKEGCHVGRFGFASQHGLEAKKKLGEALYSFAGPSQLSAELFEASGRKIFVTPSETLHDVIVTGDNVEGKTYHVAHQQGAAKEPLFLARGKDDLSWVNYFLGETPEFLIQIIFR